MSCLSRRYLLIEFILSSFNKRLLNITNSYNSPLLDVSNL